MVATLRAAWGPEFNDYHLYDPDGISGYSIVSTPSPPGGTYAIKGLNVTAGAVHLRGPTADAFSAQPYTWLILEGFRADGTFTASDKFGIWQLWGYIPIGGDDGNALLGVGQSDGKYKVGLYQWYQGSLTQNALSSSSYSSGAWISIRVQYDGSRCKVWINGTLEIDHATTLQPTNGRVQLFHHSGDMGTVTKYWSGYACLTSSSASDRPGTDLGRHRLTPDGNTSETDYGDQTECADATLGSYTKWDDWAGGGQNNGDTDFNCDGGVAGQEASTLTTATISDDVLGVMVHHMRKANVADKVMNNYARLKYGGSTSEIELGGMGTSYYPNSVVFLDPPGGGSWTQTKIDGLEAGVRTPVGNGASLLVTAVGVEVFTIDADPPATPPLQHPPLRGVMRGVMRGQR